MIGEEQRDNVTDFAEAKAKLEQKRQRGLFLRSNKSTLALAVFLHSVRDAEEKYEIDLKGEEAIALERLMLDITKTLTYPELEIKISRTDIDMIGNWAVSINVLSRRNKRGLYKALVDLNREFVRTGGPDNLEFKEKIKNIVGQK